MKIFFFNFQNTNPWLEVNRPLAIDDDNDVDDVKWEYCCCCDNDDRLLLLLLLLMETGGGEINIDEDDEDEDKDDVLELLVVADVPPTAEVTFELQSNKFVDDEEVDEDINDDVKLLIVDGS